MVSMKVPLPPSGVFNYASVNIPAGVTITFKRNAANTPVVILAQGDIVVAGTIDVSGKRPAPIGGAGDGNLADDGIPGEGGPGGFDGGPGGYPAGPEPPPPGASTRGGDGLGPGGGGGAQMLNGYSIPGAGGGHATSGQSPSGYGTPGGATYGTPTLRPLIGGSGGGGASGASSMLRGGGGGAILLAASGTVHISGSILALGDCDNLAVVPIAGIYQSKGGGGAGGAIRVVGTTVSGSGQLIATGAAVGCNGHGGDGRIRLEAETLNFNVGTNPTYTSAPPASVFLPSLPGLAITSIGGLPVPAEPTGNGDVTLPAATANPVTIDIQTNGIPIGSVVKVRVTPANAPSVSVDSAPTTGTLQNGATSVQVDIPDGASVVSATTTFTVTAELKDRLAPFARGERVEKVRLTATPGQPSTMALLTASGRELALPAAALAAIP